MTLISRRSPPTAAHRSAAAPPTAAATAVTAMEDSSIPGRTQSERKRSGNKAHTGIHSTVDRNLSSDKLPRPVISPIDYDDHILATSIAVAQCAGITCRQPAYAHISRLLHGQV